MQGPTKFLCPKAWLSALAICLCLATLAILADLPAPGPDDLFYVGPALSIAKHGPLRSELLANQGFLSKDFLIYPAFYQYLLGAWLRLTGISTLSIHLFTHLSYLLGAFGLSYLLAQTGSFGRASPFWPPLAYLAILSSLGTMGFRSEALGFGVLASGLILALEGGATRRLLSWVLIGASVLISPNVLPYAASGRLALLLLDGRGWKLRLRTETPALTAAILFDLLLLAWSIDGRWTEFTRAFLHHASRAILPFWESVCMGLIRYLCGFRVFPVTLLSLALCLTAIGFARLREACRKQRKQLILILSIWFTAGLLSIGMTWVREELRLFTLVLAGLTSGLWLMARPGLRAYGVSGLCVLGMACLWLRDPLAPRWSPSLRPTALHISAARQAVQAEPLRRYLIDSHTARTVFDYRLPENARDWFFSQPFPGLYPTSLKAMKEEETWIISGINLRLCDPSIASFEPYLELPFLKFRRFRTDFDVFLLDGRKPPQGQLER